MSMIPMSRFVFARGRDTTPVQLTSDLSGVYALGGEMEDQAHHLGGLWVRLLRPCAFPHIQQNIVLLLPTL